MRSGIDYSRLNEIARKDVYTLEHKDDALEWLLGADFFSFLRS